MATLELINNTVWERAEEVWKSKQGMEDKSKGVTSGKVQGSFLGGGMEKRQKTQGDPPSSEHRCCYTAEGVELQFICVSGPFTPTQEVQEAWDRFL